MLELDELVADFVGDHHGGVAALIVRDDIMATAATGMANANGDEITPETPFRVGSISKPFVATMVLQLVDEDDRPGRGHDAAWSLVPWSSDMAYETILVERRGRVGQEEQDEGRRDEVELLGGGVAQVGLLGVDDPNLRLRQAFVGRQRRCLLHHPGRQVTAEHRPGRAHCPGEG